MKKLKRGKTLEEEDWISSLPDDVPSHILSLVSTKESVATSTLSTRWKNLYALVPYLDINDAGSLTTNIQSFDWFVFKVLLAVLTKGTHVRNFKVICNDGTYPSDMVSLWMFAAVSGHNIKELIVNVRNQIHPIRLEPELFNCRLLTIMKLKGKFLLSVPEYVHFPNLKALELSGLIIMGSKSIAMFLCGCFVLEELRISACKTDLISVLEVSVATLKSFSLYDTNGRYALFLNAPRLEYFDCDTYAKGGYYGTKLKSLVRAEIDIVLEDEQFEDEKLSQLICLVSNARTLTLTGDSIKTLINVTEKFRNLTDLRISVGHVDGWMSLPNLFHISPSLEKLSFEGSFYDKHGNYPELASYLPERVPICVSTHLKEVTVDYFEATEAELKLVEYFLKNAKVLEKMIITPGLSLAVKEGFLMMKKLLALPRCSRACRIIFMG